MCTGNGDTHLIFHQSTKEVCALVNRDACLLCSLDLHIIFSDRRRTHDPIHACQVAWIMSKIYFPAYLTDVFGKGSQRAVRTAHPVSALQKETGDGGKTASPNADEMDMCHFSS